MFIAAATSKSARPVVPSDDSGSPAPGALDWKSFEQRMEQRRQTVKNMLSADSEYDDHENTGAGSRLPNNSGLRRD